MNPAWACFLYVTWCWAPEDCWKHPPPSAAVVCQAALIRKKYKGLICSLLSLHLSYICASRCHIFHLLSVSCVPAPSRFTEAALTSCYWSGLHTKRKNHSVKQNQLVNGVSCVSSKTFPQRNQMEFFLFFFFFKRWWVLSAVRQCHHLWRRFRKKQRTRGMMTHAL